ncbi:hypothetical protein AVDCRST_MAG81-3850 [uncultured Synechococcales cyanobacterium]|uniref:Uncharacterized protein n=1 Tax=uncultured Synechococcales cyanobacterium TaxID=1936017 RepID=A0A6J4VQQ1_9CYAN|nr:hypothetical protein AVDCRST_MAG81-3850 [uncultured Synechococcales cyanobacterium]
MEDLSKELTVAQKHGPWTIQELSQKYQNLFVHISEDQVLQPDGNLGRTT